MIKNIIITLGMLMLSTQAIAQASLTGQIVEGQHYVEIEQPPALPPGKGVVVTEVFSYLCNHCNTFEPYVQSWKSELPEGVTFNRIPVEFGRAIWGLYARAYITASVLGIDDESHVAMMDNLWKERKQLRSMEQMGEFYSQFGPSAEEFVSTSESFAVDMRMKREQQMVREFGVSGTPSMIVNNKYRVAAGGANSSFDQMLATVDFLVARELAAASVAEAAEQPAVTAAAQTE